MSRMPELNQSITDYLRSKDGTLGDDYAYDGSNPELEEYILLKQCVAEVIESLEGVVKDLNQTQMRGVTSDHVKVLAWQSKETVADIVKQLKKLTD
jgi:hypothetical protein